MRIYPHGNFGDLIRRAETLEELHAIAAGVQEVLEDRGMASKTVRRLQRVWLAKQAELEALIIETPQAEPLIVAP